MRTGLRRGATLAIVTGGLIGVGLASWAEDPPRAAEDPGRDRIQGVILTIEPIRQRDDVPSDPARSAGAADRSGAGHVLISVNTAAIWVDWVRDQAIAPTQADDPAETKRGTDSVATRGQPASPQTVIRVTATPKTAVQARFRSSTDEVTVGAPTPEAAAKRDPAASGTDDEAKGKKAEESTAQKLTLQDLKPGQWIEVDATASGDTETARRIQILTPIGGPDTPAAEAKPD